MSKIAEIFKKNGGSVPKNIKLIEFEGKYNVFYDLVAQQWVLGYDYQNNHGEIFIDEKQLLELCKSYPLIRKMAIKECSYLRYCTKLVYEINNLTS